MRRPEDHFDAGDDRLAHILKVMETARAIEERQCFDGRLVLAAAYHDIAYAADLAVSGYHPVDGAVLAQTDGLDDEIVDAVLHHSGARALAVRIRPDLTSFYGPECRMMATALSRALTFCDNHTGPQGQWVTLSERIGEIRVRHVGNAALMDVLDMHVPDFQAIEAEFLSLLA